MSDETLQLLDRFGDTRTPEAYADAPDDPSGLSLARAAHEAGAVTTTAEAPNQLVSLTFVVHGSQERAEEIALEIAKTLVDREELRRVGFDVQEWTL